MIIDIKFKETYKSFRLNCDYIIEDSNPQDINTLRFLMQQRGFRRKKDGTRLPPTDTQVTLAWDYISQKRVWDEPVQPKPTYILKWVSAYTYKRNNKEIHVKKYRRKYKNV